MATLGDMIVQRRRAAALTQRELASLVGLSVGAVRDIEQGRTRRPHPQSLRRLASALGLSDDELLRLAEPATAFRLSVLGPLRAALGDRVVDLGPPQQRTVLGLLALSPNTEVHRESIVDAIWAGRSTDGAVPLIHTYVSGLRRALNTGVPEGERRTPLVSRGPHYQLVVADEELDLLEFRAHVRDEDFASALRLVRGAPVADLDCLHELPQTTAIRFEHIAAVLGYADAALARGESADVLPHLRGLAETEALNTGVHARLMLALAATGQTGLALRHYDLVRRRLAAELGLSPDQVLVDAHERILRGSPVVVRRGPAQLPADTADFTGRAAEVAQLRELLASATSATPVCAITGTGGVGKTTLAVHVAHRVRERFPDGQLYLDLRGASPAPTPPSEALAEMLRALGVSPGDLPTSETERAALFRTRLAESRTLVVLDNARDPAQVRSLLPGSASCAVLITSRHRMAVLPGVRAWDLAPLADDEAAALLCRVAGIPPESPDATTVARLCGGLPLAMRVTGARATEPGGLTALAGKLAADPLSELAVDDVSVTAGFRLSVDLLDDGPAHLFRCLGLLDGPDLPVPVAARLLGGTETEAEAALASLHRVNLVNRADGRYAAHDLLRMYARLRAVETDPSATRLASLRRVLAWYLATARRGCELVEPFTGRGAGGADDEPGLELDSREQGERWVSSERVNLLALTRQALLVPELADLGLHLVRAQSWVFGLVRYNEQWEQILWLANDVSRDRDDARSRRSIVAALALSVSCHDLIASRVLNEEVVELARTAGDHKSEAHALINLGVTCHQLGEPADAVDCYERARVIGHEHDRRIEGYALANLAASNRELGYLDRAAEYNQQAIDLAGESGDRHLEFQAIDDLACTLRAAGDYPAALAAHEAALRVIGELGGDPLHEGPVLMSIGVTRLALGEPAAVLDVTAKAVRCFEAVGDRLRLGQALHLLGQAHHRLGDIPSARSHLRRAVAILTPLKVPDAEAAKTLLDGL
jgi:DNA-binding SARP family transcriptional activator/tetratricopeptide (TPR) repeat protein/DNA-binding XRE family transcriptional regulator